MNSVVQDICNKARLHIGNGQHVDVHLTKTNSKRLDMKRELTNFQRQLNAEERHSSFHNITNTHSGDNAIFYEIIRRQRQNGKRVLDCLSIDNVHFGTPDLICESLNLTLKLFKNVFQK